MSDAAQQKVALRIELRRRRQSLSARQQSDAAEALARHVAELPAWSDARALALYLAADGEIDTQPLAKRARAEGKSLYLPVVKPDDSLAFALWQPGAELTPNRYGIPEPAEGGARFNSDQLDLIFLPLVGWDRTGGRLGMGGGFYDRTLRHCTGPVLVGLAHSCQEVVGALPVEEWDIRLNYVATESALLDCRE